MSTPADDYTLPISAGSFGTVVEGRLMLPGEWTPQEASAYVLEPYARGVAAWVETGQRLSEAKRNLGHGKWLPMVDLLPFGERMAQRFMAIAQHPALANPSHGTDLPASPTTLAVLTQLPVAEIEARIKAGEITPELDRATAEQWARVHQAAKQEAINAWTEAVDGLTRALSWAKSYSAPPVGLPASHVQPDEFVERLTALTEITTEWSI